METRTENTVEQDDFSKFLLSEEAEETLDELDVEEQDDSKEDEEDLEKSEEEEETKDESEEKPQKDVPVFKHIKMKQKFKGRIQEKEDEINRLREENLALKRKSSAVEELPALPEKPKRDSFDSDEAYEEAYENWNEQRITFIVAKEAQQKARVKNLEAVQEKRAAEVDAHYERVAELSENSKIAPDVLKSADASFRGVVEALYPKKGDQISDHLIALLGKGSEKVITFVGRNSAARNELQSLLLEDPDGLKAAVFLGRQLEKFNTAAKVRSAAPKPAASAKGSVKTVSASEKVLKKQYEEAHSKGNSQKAFNIKKQAKAANIDVSAW